MSVSDFHGFLLYVTILKMFFFSAIFQGHSSFVTHLDWSVDGKYLQSNSGDYEVLFCKWSSVPFHF